MSIIGDDHQLYVLKRLIISLPFGILKASIDVEEKVEKTKHIIRCVIQRYADKGNSINT